MDEKVLSAIVDMYSKCGNITYAEKIFQPVIDSDRDAILYNVAGYAHHGFDNEAIQLFEGMLKKSIKIDAITFVPLWENEGRYGLCLSLSPGKSDGLTRGR